MNQFVDENSELSPAPSTLKPKVAIEKLSYRRQQNGRREDLSGSLRCTAYHQARGFDLKLVNEFTMELLIHKNLKGFGEQFGDPTYTCETWPGQSSWFSIRQKLLLVVAYSMLERQTRIIKNNNWLS